LKAFCNKYKHVNILFAQYQYWLVYGVKCHFSTIFQWRSVLFVELTGVSHQPVVSHWQILPQNVVSSTPRHERGSNSQL
jgi:hypothetical protein